MFETLGILPEETNWMPLLTYSSLCATLSSRSYASEPTYLIVGVCVQLRSDFFRLLPLPPFFALPLLLLPQAFLNAEERGLALHARAREAIPCMQLS